MYTWRRSLAKKCLLKACTLSWNSTQSSGTCALTCSIPSDHFNIWAVDKVLRC